jgi:Outer membrane protein beta-barrel domain
MAMKKAILFAVVCLILGADRLMGVDWGLSAGAGACLLRQKEVQDIYGSGFPFGVQAWSGSKNWRISVGYEYLSESGQAVALDGGSEEFPLKLKAGSIPIALYYQVGMKNIFLALGGGASYAWYEESWEDLDKTVKGHKWGPLVSFLAGYRFSPSWSIFGDIRYEPMPTGKSSLLVPEVKLGGLKIGAGVMFYL